MLRVMRAQLPLQPRPARISTWSGASSRAWLRLALLIAALALSAVLATPGAVRAAPPSLSNGTATPVSGTTATTFVFAVTYTGSKPASSVVVLVANRTVSLSLVSGTATDGRYSGSALLPAGSWPAVFQASATIGADPKPLAGPTVLVTPSLPPPTPRPTPPGTPAASATPAPTATRVPSSPPSPIAPTPLPSGVASPSVGSGEPSSSGEATPFGTTVGDESSSAEPSASTSRGPSAGNGDVEQQLTTFLTGGVVAVGLLGAIGFAAIYADRRRRRAASPAAGPPGAQPPPSAPAPKVRASRPGGWEDYALDNEPIGTVEPDPEPPSADE